MKQACVKLEPLIGGTRIKCKRLKWLVVVHKHASAGASLERPQHAFSQAELQAVQLVVSTLGKACAIEKRAALERSQLDAVQAQTNDFVSEVQPSRLLFHSQPHHKAHRTCLDMLC